MFMFRSRRTNLTRKLVKARKRRDNEKRRSAEEETERIGCLLRRLQENQLEMLLTAVENRGRDLSNCVLLPREYEPHVLCCQAWRWPDLRQSSELRRLPACRSACDPVYICCNPYHWSRVCQPESSPPPYSCCAMDRLKPEDRAPCEVPLVCRNTYPGSLTTNGQDSSMNTEWCSLAYWELTQRVGPLFPVEPMAVNVFGNVPYGDGLSLEMLAQQMSKSNPPDSVVRTRCKIGLGVTLLREEDCVWVYNLSDNAIFVNSLTLEDMDSPTKVPAEHCLCVYDPVKAAHHNDDYWDFTNHVGPVNPYSIRISFVKGWGRGYSRQDITSCPCWLEILLSPCR